MYYLNYLYILFTIIFTVYGQLIIKWRIKYYGSLPEDSYEKLIFLISIILDPYILSGFISAFLASLAWMAAMTKFNLSHAYPFMGLNFVFVLILSAWLLNEPLNISKIVGVILIILGTIIASSN